MSLASASEIRRALRRELPPEAFRRQPHRGILALVGFAITAGIAASVVAFDFPWWVDLPLAALIGEGMASVGLAAHESEHGATFEHRLPRAALAWAGFGPLLVTPGLWRAWHVRAHHRGANQVQFDPDMLSDVGEIDDWIMRLRMQLFTGSRHPLAWVGWFVLFSLEGQFFLWVASERQPMRDVVSFDRWRLRATSVLWIGGWIALAAWLGPWDALVVQFLPLAVANAILMMYITTQHWLRPRVDHDDPFSTTLSVEVPRWMNLLHYQFSYHQEHHIFPGMSPRYAPLVRETLKRIAPDAVAVLPLGTVLRELMRAPKLYADDVTLQHADGTGTVDLEAFARRRGVPIRRP